MQHYWKRLFAGFTLALGLYILYLIVVESQAQLAGEGMVAALSQFDGRIIPLLIGSQVLVVLCRFIEWQYYMGIVGATERLSTKDSAIIFIACFMMVVSPGKAGELLKAVFVQTRTGVSAARVAPAVLAERVVDGLAAMLLMASALLLAGDSLRLASVNGTDYNAIARGLIFSSRHMYQAKTDGTFPDCALHMTLLLCSAMWPVICLRRRCFAGFKIQHFHRGGQAARGFGVARPRFVALVQTRMCVTYVPLVSATQRFEFRPIHRY